MKKMISAYSLLLFTFSGLPVFAQSIGLEDYLKQVDAKYDGAVAAKLASEGAELRSREGVLLYSPNLYAEGSYTKDNLRSATTPFPLQKTYGMKAGIRQNTPVGLEAEIGTSLKYQAFRGLTGNPVMKGEHHITLSLSLWQNLLGAKTRALKTQIEDSAMASHHLEKFRYKQYLVSAELTYWNLALARQNVANQKEALERAEKFFSFSAGRRKLQLNNESDYFQSSSNVELRRLRYQASLDEARVVANDFNKLRGVASMTVSENLEALDPSKIDSLVAIERVDKRDDVKAAELQESVAAARAKIGAESLKPEVKFFTTLAVQGEGLNGNHSQGYKDATAGKNPAYMIGVNISAPLMFGWTYKSKQGYDKELEAAEIRSRLKTFEAERDWENLSQLFSEAKKRVQISHAVEQAQKKRFSAERSLFDRGRSTTFQVVTSEQSLADSQFARLQSQAQLLNVYAQMKLYR